MAKHSCDSKISYFRSINVHENPYFQLCKFKYPTFTYLDEDIQKISEFGKITNNWIYDMPLVIFNTYNFDMQEYDHAKGRFESLHVSDEYNLKDKMPKYFKSKVVSDNEVVFMGGWDILDKDGQQEHVSSDKAFRIFDGKIEQLSSR